MAINSMFSGIAQMAKSMLPPRKHKLEDENGVSQLNEQQIHLWEHAALLYHAYEWQAAADTFALLSKDMHDRQLRLFCLLNTAMILARVGDYDAAASILDRALEVDETSTMATFLKASVAYQLQDYIKAEKCFEFCWNAIGDHKPINYRDVGLHFVLDREIVRSNLREACVAPSRRGMAPIRIHAIPAEFIFEAPIRIETNSKIVRDNRRRSSALRKLANFVTPASVSVESSKPKEVDDLSPITSRPSLLCMPEAVHPVSKRQIPPTTNGEFKFRISLGDEPRSPKPLHLSWRGRPKTPYTPRDARAASDNTGELATFIKKGMQAKHMTPRDPRGEYESVLELSTFAQDYAPENVRRKTPELFDLDPEVISDIFLAAMLSEHYGSEITRDPRKDSPILDRPVAEQSNEQSSYLDQGRTAIPVVCPEVACGEILLPAVYQPPPKQARDHSYGLCKGPGTASQSRAQIEEHLFSKTDSSFERHKRRQRALALEALEGKHDLHSTWNKTFPPHGKPATADADSGRSRASWRFRSPSPVDTEHFFDEVMK